MRYAALIRYFYFSRTERRGAMALIGLSLVIYAGGLIVGNCRKPAPFDYTRYAAELQAWEAQLQPTVQPIALPAAPFDPNTLTAEDWERFGIPARAARGILTYRDKSGGFRRKSDVAKLYAVSDSLFAQLVPFIQLPTTTTAGTPNTPIPVKLFPFDPNSASAEELRRLGLSEKVVANIVKYRSRGGTFKRPADFEKIYGIGTTQFAELKPYLRFPDAPNTHQTATTSTLFEFDPNTVTIEELQQLGLSARAAKGLANYRKAGASFKQPQDMAKVYGVSDSLYARLAPYIKIEPEAPIPTAAEVAITLKEFDPNTATQPELIALGLPPPVAYGLVRYREAGGAFRTAADFGKLRSITPEQYERLKPYIRIAARASMPEIIIDINTATADDWQQLRGIGPGYTRRILEQRERMGGFGSWEMLQRTPGLPDSVYQRIRPFLLLHAPPVTDIYINRIDAASLIAHPMLTKAQALSLIEFRQAEGGTIKNFKRLQKSRVAESVLEAIRPLLHFEP